MGKWITNITVGHLDISDNTVAQNVMNVAIQGRKVGFWFWCKLWWRYLR